MRCAGTFTTTSARGARYPELRYSTGRGRTGRAGRLPPFASRFCLRFISMGYLKFHSGSFRRGIWRWLVAKRHYRMSPRLLRALETLASGGVETLGQAAEIAGAVRYAIKKENVRAWLREHVATTFATGQLAASRTMLGLLRSENSMSQFRAAAWIFGINGVSPIDNRGPLVSLNMHGGYLVNLRPDSERDGPLTEADRQALSPAGGTLLGSMRVGSAVEGVTANPVINQKPIDEQR